MLYQLLCFHLKSESRHLLAVFSLLPQPFANTVSTQQESNINDWTGMYL